MSRWGSLRTPVLPFARFVWFRLATPQVLVNNASVMPSIFEDPTSTLDATDAMTVRINVEGTWLVTKHALPLLKEGAGPDFERTVVFMSSAASFLEEPEEANGMLPYHASKAAVNALMVHLHQVYGVDSEAGTKRLKRVAGLAGLAGLAGSER